MTDAAKINRTLSRDAKYAEETIVQNIDAMMRELQTMKEHLAAGYRLNELNHQRPADLNRAIIKRQVAFDTSVMLDIELDTDSI